MDKYEYKLKTEQMLKLMENGAYNRAAEIADSIDWKRVRNVNMLLNVSNIYEKIRDYRKSFGVLRAAYHRTEGSRKILYRLCTLAIKVGNLEEAIDYYDEYVQAAPKDPNIPPVESTKSSDRAADPCVGAVQKSRVCRRVGIRAGQEI